MRTILLATLLLAACAGSGDRADASDSAAQASGAHAETSAGAGEIADSAHVAAAIQAQVQALTDAYGSGDASAAAAVYGEDAVLRSLEGPASDAYGSAAIEASFERFFQRNPGVEATFEVVALRVWADSAIADGRFDISFGEGAGAPEPVLGSFQHRWQRQPDGSWRIVEDRSTLDEGAEEQQ